MSKKSEPKTPSPLGLEIEAAVEGDPRYRRHRANVLYLCTFRTVAGTVFGFERVTRNAIRLWLPPTGGVKAAIAAEHLHVPTISRPWPDLVEPKRYGRISSLRSIPELRDEPLLPVPVTSAQQALVILTSIH